ncbi:MAG: ATPase [Cyanobacteria bacterium P01_H01_bin.15]
MAPPIVKRFLISLNENKILGAITCLLVTGGAAIYAVQPPPEAPPKVWKAVGQLSFDNSLLAFTTAGELLQARGRTFDRSFLLSSTVLQDTAQRLGQTPDKLVRAINEGRLGVGYPEDDQGNPVEAPQAVQMFYFSSGNRQEVQDVLQTLMEEVVNYSRFLNSSQLSQRVGILEDRLGEVSQDLVVAEESFYRYISGEGASLLAIQDGSLFNGITNSQRQQQELKGLLDGIQAEMGTIMSQLNLTPDEAYTNASLSADPIIAQLRAQILGNELEIERLSGRLRPEHPQLKALLEQKAVNEKLLQERATEIIGDDGILVPLPDNIRRNSNLDPARRELANRLLLLEGQRDNIQQQLVSVTELEGELRQQYEQFPDKQIQQAQLVQAVEGQRILYQTILAALVDARSAEAEAISSLIIAQPSVVPPVPDPDLGDKNPYLITGLGAGGGLVLALALIFWLAMIDDRLHSIAEIRQALTEREVPRLGMLPFVINIDDLGEESAILVNHDRTYLPFYERFRSNIRRIGRETTKVVMITSVLTEEGKTTSSYNLAIASANAGKRTLLIEADLRSSSLAGTVGVELEPYARVEPLRYYGARNSAIKLVPDIENLSLLATPGPQARSAALMESAELRQLIKDARGRYDIVIIDTPALSESNDALLLEPLVDGVVLVTRPGLTRGSLLTETLDQFTELEVPLLGAVINDVEDLIAIDDFDFYDDDDDDDEEAALANLGGDNPDGDAEEATVPVTPEVV